MRYQGPYNDIIFPRGDRTPGIASYRLVFFYDAGEPHAIIHILPKEGFDSLIGDVDADFGDDDQPFR